MLFMPLTSAQIPTSPVYPNLFWKGVNKGRFPNILRPQSTKSLLCRTVIGPIPCLIPLVTRLKSTTAISSTRTFGSSTESTSIAGIIFPDMSCTDSSIVGKMRPGLTTHVSKSPSDAFSYVTTKCSIEFYKCMFSIAIWRKRDWRN